MTQQRKILIGLAILALFYVTFEAGRYSKAAKVEIVTKEVIKEVIKEVKSVDVKNNKVVTIHTVKNTDGSITTDTTITDKGTSESHSTTDISKEVIKELRSTTTRDSGLSLQALALVPISDLRGDREYGLAVSKRILGNIRVGILGTTDKKIGISVGLDF